MCDQEVCVKTMPPDEPPDGAPDCDCTRCLCERIDELFRCDIALFDHAELSVQEFRELYDEVLALMTRVCAPLPPEVQAAPDYVPPFNAVPPGTDDEMDIPF